MWDLAGSDAIEREFIAGDFSGQLLCWDVEYLTKPMSGKNAHESIIIVDGCYNQHWKGSSQEVEMGLESMGLQTETI